MNDLHGTSGPDPHPDREQDGVSGDVCWLAATCVECGALVEGGTCWNCGTARRE
ncbi:MAG TPA: hypothetical protein VFR98_02130 [Agromyces sp.]|nr:hypothetical protein [Agromyces sp.]